MPTPFRLLPPLRALATAAALAGTCAAWAANEVYVVAPDGSDKSRGDLEHPLRTLREAVNRVQPGDTIELRAGTYTGAVVISGPGRADAWIRLRAHAGEKATVQGDGKGPTLYFYHRSCDQYAPRRDELCEPMYWEVEGLEIVGSPDGQDDGNVVKIDTPRVNLLGNDLWGSRVDVVKLVRTANDVNILGNRIHAPRAKPGDNAQGVDIVGADRVRVAYNHVHDIPSIGMYSKGNSRNTVFEHNLVERTWSHAIMLGQETDAHRLTDGRYETYDGIIRDNLVVQAGWSCLATSSSQNVLIEHNTCIDTGLDKHGSVLVSNESEVGQAGTNIRITDNVFLTRSTLPMIKLAKEALTEKAAIQVDRNLYGSRAGLRGVTFTWRDQGLEMISFDAWKSVTRLDAGSQLADVRAEGGKPEGRSTSATPLAGRGARGTPGPAGWKPASAAQARAVQAMQAAQAPPAAGAAK
jgi:hypothetical protein